MDHKLWLLELFKLTLTIEYITLCHIIYVWLKSELRNNFVMELPPDWFFLTRINQYLNLINDHGSILFIFHNFQKVSVSL